MYKRKEEPKPGPETVLVESKYEPEQVKEVPPLSKTPEKYILKVEGLISQVQRELEKAPEGYIPTKVVLEVADVHTFGKQSYLFFMEKSKVPGEKAVFIDAVGLEELQRKVESLYSEAKLIDIVSQPVNKRLKYKKMYLAIFVKNIA